MSFNRLQIASFLDKVARAYPSGIPATAVVTSRHQPAYSCRFFLVSDSPLVSDTYAELIDAICIKGLKFDRSTCDVRVVSQVEEGVATSDAPLTVVLGGSRPPGAIEELENGRVLFSHAIEGISSNANTKREFWGHLQALLRR